MDVLAFQRTWIDAFRQKERSAYVTHFNDRFDPRFFAITEVARELDRLRENWLTPLDPTEAELKKRTLTDLSNARSTWIANAGAALDRAVWVAYGWPGEEVSAEVAERVIFARVPAIDRRSHRCGLHGRPVHKAGRDLYTACGTSL